MSDMKIVLSQGYAWILFEVILIGIHMWITGMFMGKVRKQFFDKNFYETKYPQYKHLSNVMKPDGGYPDDGQGRLADLLDDEQWFIFNNYRRAHMNYLEVRLFLFYLIDLVLKNNLIILGGICSYFSFINCRSILYSCDFFYWNYLSCWSRNLFSRLSSIRIKRSSNWSSYIRFSSSYFMVNGFIYMLRLGKWFNWSTKTYLLKNKLSYLRLTFLHTNPFFLTTTKNTYLNTNFVFEFTK